MSRYDLAVIGGGVMGCCAALRAARGGLRTVVVERAALGSGASGVNAGTLSLQIKRTELIPYALRGHAWWKAAGDAVGFKRTGGFTLAFTPAEAELLAQRMTARIAAGAPIELVSPERVAADEPAIARRVVAASWCAEDGYADALRTGAYLGGLLRDAGVAIRPSSPVGGIDRAGDGYTLATPGERIDATRVLLACGAWLGPVAAMLDVAFPLHVRTNIVTVTERAPRLVGGAIGHATGLLTLKQKANGTVLIGGGWQGRGSPAHGHGEVLADAVRGNLQLARFVVPAVASLRIVRSWTGFEPHVPDFYPLAGRLPGHANAFVLGCVRGGYTIGPCLGELIGDQILERDAGLPRFDPSRFAGTRAGAGAATAA